MADPAQEPIQPELQTQEARPELRFRNSVPDWTIRAVIFLAFLYFGTAKFKSDSDAPWVVLFSQIGLGQWLRDTTGVLEVGGAFLVLFSGAVEIGLAILLVTMCGAIIAAFFVLHRPSEAFFPFAFLSGMIAFWLHRRRV
jgi:putative oxidoreductase